MKYKLGNLIEQSDKRNSSNEYTLEDLKGISIQKIFIETKAKMDGVSLTPYKLVEPDEFAYVTVTSRNSEKITLAHNDTGKTYIVSSSYIVFKVNEPNVINSDYLYMYFNRPEFDRYARFNSWGSARETFSWDDMCDIEIDLPPLEIQEKYVAVYKALLANQKSYENGLEDLKLVCDATIEKLRRELPYTKIKSFLEQVDVRNSDSKYTLDNLKGISIKKEFIETKAKMAGVSLTPYKVVEPDQFAYVTVTSRNSEKITLAHNNSDNTYIVSSSYIVFQVTDTEQLNLAYLSMIFGREEFNRYARFNSWGSARETFSWDDMQEVSIAIPDISLQDSIVEIYNAYLTRKELSEKLKNQINEICSILISGSVKEAMQYEQV